MKTQMALAPISKIAGVLPLHKEALVPPTSVLKLFEANTGHVIALVAATALTLLAVYPIAVHLWKGWAARKGEITSSFSDAAMQLYLDHFQKHMIQGNSAKQMFDEIYDLNFGRFRFVFPMIIFTIICAGATFFSCEWAVTHMLVVQQGRASVFGAIPAGVAAYISLPTAGSVSVVGGYLWIVADLFIRAQRQDMQPIDVLNSALRLALSAPIGYAVAAIAGNSSLMLPIAFSAGAFPLATVRTMLRRFATQKLNAGVGIEDGEDQVIEISCVDKPTAERLLDADISTVSQLAYCDPVRLTMRTGLKFDYIVDIAAQALAWLYFESKLDILRPAGLRGAIEIGNLLRDAAGDPTIASTRRALALCDIAADMVGLSPVAFLNACDETVEDPATIFLSALWRSA